MKRLPSWIRWAPGLVVAGLIVTGFWFGSNLFFGPTEPDLGPTVVVTPTSTPGPSKSPKTPAPTPSQSKSSEEFVSPRHPSTQNDSPSASTVDPRAPEDAGNDHGDRSRRRGGAGNHTDSGNRSDSDNDEDTRHDEDSDANDEDSDANDEDRDDAD